VPLFRVTLSITDESFQLAHAQLGASDNTYNRDGLVIDGATGTLSHTVEVSAMEVNRAIGSALEAIRPQFGNGRVVRQPDRFCAEVELLATRHHSVRS
jgi:hypothetical protein